MCIKLCKNLKKERSLWGKQKIITILYTFQNVKFFLYFVINCSVTNGWNNHNQQQYKEVYLYSLYMLLSISINFHYCLWSINYLYGFKLCKVNKREPYPYTFICMIILWQVKTLNNMKVNEIFYSHITNINKWKITHTKKEVLYCIILFLKAWCVEVLFTLYILKINADTYMSYRIY